ASACWSQSAALFRYSSALVSMNVPPRAQCGGRSNVPSIGTDRELSGCGLSPVSSFRVCSSVLQINRSVRAAPESRHQTPRPGMSALGHKRILAALFDHLVNAAEVRRELPGRTERTQCLVQAESTPDDDRGSLGNCNRPLSLGRRLASGR